MAVLDGVPGLQVQIVVHGQALREYQDQDAKVSEKTVDRYIEAHTGAEFQICYSFDGTFPGDRAVSMIITIDGTDMEEPLIRQYELYEPEGHVSRGPVHKIGPSYEVRKYRFAPIDIREGEGEITPENMKARLQRIGIITCEFYFLNNARLSHHLCGRRKEIEVLPPVSEKAIKGDALSHQAILGATEPTEEVEYYDADYADGGEPFATFHFYYRSLAALKDLHIIERSPEPLDFLNNDDEALAQLNREQLEAIVRRFREQADARARTKRERSSSETMVGDDDDVGDRRQNSDPDLIELRWVDLRAMRKAKRIKQLPTRESEVIVIDD